MPNQHKPCPRCGETMHRQSKLCIVCARKDPEWKAKVSAGKTGKPSPKSPETRRKMSAAAKGKKKSYPTGGSLPGVADKIRQAWTPEMRESARIRGLERAQDPEWRLRCGMPGEKNPMWEDGRSQIPYSPGWARKVKETAWQRAEHRCEICGGVPRDTHHMDFQKNNHALDNLQVLCRKCHKRLHADHLKNKNPQD